MPTYDYRCPNGHDFEHFFRKISEAAAELSCPQCGAVAVRRVSGGAGLLFKGSGFYLTDYGKNAHRKAGSGTGPSPKSDSAGESSAKSEAKSDGGSSASDGASSSSAKPESAKSESKPAAKPKGGDA